MAALAVVPLLGFGCQGASSGIDYHSHDVNADQNQVGLNESDGGAGKTSVAINLEEIARRSGVLENYGGLYTYLDITEDGINLIIQDTFSSRQKYKSITPFLLAYKEKLIINCTYLRAFDDKGMVSVGSYCRDQSEATVDSLEDAINNNNIIPYTTEHPWLTSLSLSTGCQGVAAGLSYSNYHVLRCDLGDSDELTDNISVSVFDENFAILVQMNGYEFSPILNSAHKDKFVFWGLHKESGYKIIYSP
ncbi:hypothetical protein [Pseudoxanthomonas putridarboris]|uniref:Lipoprotein n=1 Tax=Pseudoxanthomonas putridarboris TaxID=752605 RepID=A0ABU9J598_9GAMM